MIDAKTLLRSLVGEPLTTIRGRPNTVLSVGEDEVAVATTRSPNGRSVPIEFLQDALDRLEEGERLSLDSDDTGYRSSFLAGVLRTLPQVEIVDNASPPEIRVARDAPRSNGVLRELERRLEMYADLLAGEGSERVSPATLRDLGIYGGASGVWVDAQRTRGVGDATSVAVGLLHTGRHYDDDLSDDALLYHYPDTDRPAGRDLSEIEATKAAGSLRLPVFVVLQQGTARTVRKGWVASWDDEQKVFLVEFGALPVVVVAGDKVDERPFEIFEERDNAKQRMVRARPNQQRFKLQVIQRYGAQCAVCDVSLLELVTAAHLCRTLMGGQAIRGTDCRCAAHITWRLTET